MSELHQRLRATLAELHGELEQLGAADAQARELLSAAMAEIGQKLGAGAPPSGGGGPPSGDGGSPSGDGATGQIAAQLTESARRFEATHPTLSRVLDNLIDMLAQMGI